MNDERIALNRRRFVETLSAIGLGGTLLPDALVIAAQDSATVTVEMIEAAQKIAGVSFTREEQSSIAARLNASRGYLAGFAVLRGADLGNDTPPAIVFNPVPPGKAVPAGPRFLRRREPQVTRPPTDEALAFLPVTHLATLVKTRQVTSAELTELYLSRLTKYDPVLHCVVTLTPELARAQARQADAEIAAGTVPGPAARVALRAEGSVRGSRHQDDVGRFSLPGSSRRPRRHRLYQAA